MAKPWFQKLCRNAGLAIHHATSAAEQPVGEPKVVLRRTTVVEEVELPGREAFARSAPFFHGDQEREEEVTEKH